MLDDRIIKELISGNLDKPIKLFTSMESAKDIAIIIAKICKYKWRIFTFWSAIYIGGK